MENMLVQDDQEGDNEASCLCKESVVIRLDDIEELPAQELIAGPIDNITVDHTLLGDVQLNIPVTDDYSLTVGLINLIAEQRDEESVQCVTEQPAQELIAEPIDYVNAVDHSLLGYVEHMDDNWVTGGSIDLIDRVEHSVQCITEQIENAQVQELLGDREINEPSVGETSVTMFPENIFLVRRPSSDTAAGKLERGDNSVQCVEEEDAAPSSYHIDTCTADILQARDGDDDLSLSNRFASSPMALPKDLSFDESSHGTMTSSNTWYNRAMNQEMVLPRSSKDRYERPFLGLEEIPSDSSRLSNQQVIRLGTGLASRSCKKLPIKREQSLGSIPGKVHVQTKVSDDHSITGETLGTMTSSSTMKSTYTWCHRLSQDTVSSRRLKDRELRSGSPRSSNSSQRTASDPVHERLYKNSNVARSTPTKIDNTRRSTSGKVLTKLSDDHSIAGETAGAMTSAGTMASSTNTWYHRLSQDTVSSRRLKEREEPRDSSSALPRSVNQGSPRSLPSGSPASRNTNQRVTGESIYERLYKTCTVASSSSKSLATMKVSDKHTRASKRSLALERRKVILETFQICLKIAGQTAVMEKQLMNLLDGFILRESQNVETREPISIAQRA